MDEGFTNDAFARTRVTLFVPPFRKIMSSRRSASSAKKLGAAAIEQRLTEIALLSKAAFPTLSWRPETLDSPKKNSLDVQFLGRHDVVQFTNSEMQSHSRVLRIRALDHRMYAVVRRLYEF